MEKKYEFTDEVVEVTGRTLHRIRALKNFGDVSIGDLGGWIEKEDNLSHEGNCWVHDDARVFENAKVSEDALVYGDSCVFGNAKIYENAQVLEHAWVSGNACVFENAQLCGYAKVGDDIHLKGTGRIYSLV